MRIWPVSFIWIVLAQLFFKFYENGEISKERAVTFRLKNSYFFTLNIEGARALQNSITDRADDISCVNFGI